MIAVRVKSAARIAVIFAACQGGVSAVRLAIGQGVGPEKPFYCFQCDSDTDPSCWDVSPTQTNLPFFKVCQVNETWKLPFCRKRKFSYIPADDKSWLFPDFAHKVVRDCYYEDNPYDLCYATGKAGKNVTQICHCFSLGCNVGSPVVSLSLSAVTVMAALSVCTLYIAL